MAKRIQSIALHGPENTEHGVTFTGVATLHDGREVKCRTSCSYEAAENISERDLWRTAWERAVITLMRMVGGDLEEFLPMMRTEH